MEAVPYFWGKLRALARAAFRTKRATDVSPDLSAAATISAFSSGVMVISNRALWGGRMEILWRRRGFPLFLDLGGTPALYGYRGQGGNFRGWPGVDVPYRLRDDAV